ncbi:FG-GAP repeat domain-containing protein [Tritonibacter aquimaris]
MPVFSTEVWNKARRLPHQYRPALARRAGLMLSLWLMTAGAVAAETVTAASFDQPTRRYAHGVLGDAIEYGSLRITSAAGSIEVVLPKDHVFEDLAPRLVDIDLDGQAEVMVVETDMARGAQLAIYDHSGKKIAETPHIGRSNRWLAPIGAADLDGDGLVELAYIDRPHLAKTLRIWRYQDGALVEVAALRGLTNHQIGQDFITSGLRRCGDTVELITADAHWQSVVATVLQADQLKSRVIGAFQKDPELKRALACDD